MAKLGFTLERNAISKPCEAGLQADRLGVQQGWVLSKVNGEAVPADKAVIMDAVKTASKTGALRLEFRMRARPDAHHCCKCDKFVLEEAYAASELGKGPGVQKCNPCVEAEDFCAMFD